MATVTLKWTVPVTRTDGSALPVNQVAGATIFQNGVSVDTVAGVVDTFTTGVLTAGTYTFTVTTQDVEGNTSAVSNVATVTIAAVFAPPSAVADLSAVVNP